MPSSCPGPLACSLNVQGYFFYFVPWPGRHHTLSNCTSALSLPYLCRLQCLVLSNPLHNLSKFCPHITSRT